MTRYAAAYAVAFIVMVVVDLIWLRWFSEAMFRPTVGELLTENPNYVAAVLFYIFYIAGLLIFAMSGALKGGGLGHAALYGALFGFFAYMTFDFTNLAILRLWTWQLALADMAWGTFLTACSAMAGYAVASRL